jgi:hypothetical protein
MHCPGPRGALADSAMAELGFAASVGAMQRGMCEQGQSRAAFDRRRVQGEIDYSTGTINGVVAPAVKPIFS